MKTIQLQSIWQHDQQGIVLVRQILDRNRRGSVQVLGCQSIPAKRNEFSLMVRATPRCSLSDVSWLRSSTMIFAFVLIVIALSVTTDSRLCADSSSEPQQLIDAIVNHNDEPKVLDIGGATITLFRRKHNWTEDNRVIAAVWNLSQNENDKVWKQLMRHCDDRRHSCCYGEQGLWAETWTVGDICQMMAKQKLICAYLLCLEPGKTAPMGGDSPNYVPDDTMKYVPGTVQKTLHNPPQFGETAVPSADPRGLFRKWVQERKSKPLYELQIEMCEWAIKTVTDAQDIAEIPKKQFTAAVKKQIELLKQTKKPVIDHSDFASPVCRGKAYPFDEEDAEDGWKEIKQISQNIENMRKTIKVLEDTKGSDGYARP